MEHEEHHLEHNLSEKSSRGFSKYFTGGLIASLVLIGGLGYGAWSYARQYQNHIAPNVFIGSLSLGRKTQDEARTLLQKQTDEILNHGVDVRLNGEVKNVPLSTLIGSDLVEYVHFDFEKTLSHLESIHHSQNPIIDTGEILFALLKPVHTKMEFVIRSPEINSSLHTLFVGNEHMAKETAFLIKANEDDWNIDIIPGISGDQVDDALFQTELSNKLRTLDKDPIDLALKERKPLVTEEVALKQVPIAKAILRAAPYHLTYTDSEETEHSWKLTSTTLQTLLVPTESGSIGLEPDVFQTFLQPIKKEINIPAQNARFQMKSGHAVEFAQSKDGISVDEEKLYKDTLSQITQGSTNPIIVATITEKPTILTADVNNLGIDEIVGVGISNYGKSPKNRKANIQNGVNLLNGLLIAPDETFSLLEALKPFTEDNGYLKELVIKRDKIEPDIGGGLCQIGTTTFRAVMHAGLPVIERQNHSLVVSYYNDPSNGNPGTDATIFDPAPDFKFKNDTGHYLLLQAENIPSKTQLRFTFWGTSDGRKGSYTPPTVSKWIPYGDDIIQTSTNLKPGEEKCQEAHKGANASFTYTITKPDGTKIDKVFTSHYRPLPKICLVGVNPSEPTSPSEPVQTPPVTP